jgi:hypothetical protein
VVCLHTCPQGQSPVQALVINIERPRRSCQSITAGASCGAASQSMKTLYRGADAGITILNAAVSAADGAVARANSLINNSPLNTLVNGARARLAPCTMRLCSTSPFAL